jgi:hypothetical protein
MTLTPTIACGRGQASDGRYAPTRTAVAELATPSMLWCSASL